MNNLEQAVKILFPTDNIKSGLSYIQKLRIGECLKMLVDNTLIIKRVLEQQDGLAAISIQNSNIQLTIKTIQDIIKE